MMFRRNRNAKRFPFQDVFESRGYTVHDAFRFEHPQTSGYVYVVSSGDGWFTTADLKGLREGRAAIVTSGASYRSVDDARRYAYDTARWRSVNGLAEPDGLWGGYPMPGGSKVGNRRSKGRAVRTEDLDDTRGGSPTLYVQEAWSPRGDGYAMTGRWQSRFRPEYASEVTEYVDLEDSVVEVIDNRLFKGILAIEPNGENHLISVWVNLKDGVTEDDFFGTVWGPRPDVYGSNSRAPRSAKQSNNRRCRK